MQFGVVFPQTEIGADPGAIREYVQAAEDLGYSYIFIADHVLGADPGHHQHVANSYYTHHSVIHEQLVTLGYISAITRKVDLITGILILPQRQTALVAKQAAEIDVLSGGRLKLGIGVGWNHVEYEALGQDFRTRGRRCEEQIEVLRALWTQRWSTLRAGGTALPTPESTPCRYSGPYPSGWVPVAAPAPYRWSRSCAASPACLMAGSPAFRPTTPAGRQ